MVIPNFTNKRVGRAFDNVEQMERQLQIEDAVWLWMANKHNYIDLSRGEYRAVHRTCKKFFRED